MTAPIVGHIRRYPTDPRMTAEDAARARATIRGQWINALPMAQGQLWARLREANFGSTTQST